jgi:ABC-type amino acid transport substrate-binding protein
VRAGAAAVLVVVAGLLAACTSSGAGSSTTTTSAVETTTTTSTLVAPRTTTAATGNPGFRTRVKDVLTVATEDPRPPFFAEGEGTAAAGFEYDVARLVASAMDVPSLRIVPGRLTTLLGGGDCECDLFIGRVKVSETLARSVDLTEPYLTVDQLVVVPAGALAPTAETARTLRWTTRLSDTDGLGYVRGQVRPLVPVTLSDDEAAALRALSAGTADAAILDLPTAAPLVLADPTMVRAGRVTTGAGYAAVLPFGSPNTGAVNDVIDGLRTRGAIGLLFRRYFGIDPSLLPVLHLS